MRTFKKIGIKSFVKFNVFYMGLIGLIGGVLTGIPVLLFGNAASSFTESGFGAGIGSAAGIGILIGTPLLYAFMGLIFGYIGGFILNLVLKLSGGIQVEMVDTEIAPETPKAETTE